MVEINVFYRDNHIYGYSITGHAEYGEPGKNIVCAGISALEDAMICTLQDFVVEYMEKKYIGGLRTIYVEKPSEKSDHILSVFIIGCERIQEAYPQCVSVKKRPKHDVGKSIGEL